MPLGTIAASLLRIFVCPHPCDVCASQTSEASTNARFASKALCILPLGLAGLLGHVGTREHVALG